MAKMIWDASGTRKFEAGVSKGVLAVMNDNGEYDTPVAWSGLSKIAESPSGAEVTKLYADNMEYLGLISSEEYGATIECYTYPPEFYECDGAVSVAKGITVGQQNRRKFGYSYQSKIGTDVSTDAGYAIHMVYGAQAKPSSKDHETVNSSPAAATMSYEITTTPVSIPGTDLKPTATLTIDSTLVDKDELAAFEKVLYGDADKEPEFLMPDQILKLFVKSAALITKG